ncbi:MAG: hypothetical protein AB7V22_10190 [Kiritimatiellia bacterium]
MSTRIVRWAALAVCVAGLDARAAFDQPTRAELKAAAEDLSKVVELLQDASIDQAAEIAKGVVIEIVKLDLSRAERDSRASSLVGYLFMTFPEGDWKDLAIVFGRMVAASPTASMDPSLLSALQRAIIEVGGVEIGGEFGNAYNLAMLTVAGAPGGGKNVPPQPPPPPVALPLRPPVATPYEAQRLR